MKGKWNGANHRSVRWKPGRNAFSPDVSPSFLRASAHEGRLRAFATGIKRNRKERQERGDNPDRVPLRRPPHIAQTRHAFVLLITSAKCENKSNGFWRGGAPGGSDPGAPLPTPNPPPPHPPRPEPYRSSLPFEWRQTDITAAAAARGIDRGVIKRFIDFIFFIFFVAFFTSCRRTLISSRGRRGSRFVEGVSFSVFFLFSFSLAKPPPPPPSPVQSSICRGRFR